MASPDEQWARQPIEGVAMNHAAWTIGHLAWVHENIAGMIGGVRTLDDDWKATFGSGSKPLSERAAYPSAEVLLSALEAAQPRLLEAAPGGRRPETRRAGA